MSTVEEKQIPTKSRVSRGGSKKNGSARSGQNGGRRQGEKKTVKKSEDDIEEDVCLICAEKFIYKALLPCNHIVCHKCGFRQRSLYEKKSCLVCRTECERIVITERLASEEYNDIKATDIETTDEKFGIDFTSSYAYADTLGLLENKCPICKDVFLSIQKLNEHVKNEHSKYYCLICESNKSSFVSELKLYNFRALQKHQQEGDEYGFTGHPECKYCRGKRFYSEDELNIHIRDHHERCHICDQNTPKTADYYKNYDNLFKHFLREHFVCTVLSCLEKKFVVFREELDLTAHMLKEHGGLMSGNKIVVGATSKQYQSQLSTFNMGQSSTSFSSNGNNRIRGSDFSSNNEVDAYETKTKRLEERAKHYLNYNTANLKKFHKINANFRSKNITAKELLIQYQELFTNTSGDDINLLIYDLSETFNETAPERNQLSLITEDLLIQDTRNRFPALSSSSSSSLVNINSWGNSSINAGTRNNNELFPTLSKSTKKSTVTVDANQPIRYLTVIKKQTKVVPRIKVSSGRTSPVQLNYLEKTSDSSNTASKPTSTKVLPEAKFPVLEKKTKKVVIPRVNPVATPTTGWGSIQQKESPKTDDDPFGFGANVVIKKKKGRK